MPLLDEQTEFSAKWSAVYTYQLEQGIDDPIIAYEYLNKFYVLEGNKRVSVLKYVKADSIREVIAFPKVKDASCLMTNAPDVVDDKQLDELFIQVVEPQKEAE